MVRACNKFSSEIDEASGWCERSRNLSSEIKSGSQNASQTFFRPNKKSNVPLWVHVYPLNSLTLLFITCWLLIIFKSSFTAGCFQSKLSQRGVLVSRPKKIKHLLVLGTSKVWCKAPLELRWIAMMGFSWGARASAPPEQNSYVCIGVEAGLGGVLSTFYDFFEDISAQSLWPIGSVNFRTKLIESAYHSLCSFSNGIVDLSLRWYRRCFATTLFWPFRTDFSYR